MTQATSWLVSIRDCGGVSRRPYQTIAVSEYGRLNPRLWRGEQKTGKRHLPALFRCLNPRLWRGEQKTYPLSSN